MQTLTIDKLKKYYLPWNASRVNNYAAATESVAIYNDSINFYQGVKLILETDFVPTYQTDLTSTPSPTNVLIASSTGTDATIAAATTTLAGVMSSTDKVNMNALITLSGMAAGSTDLNSFTGSLILDDRTIKQALQDLETAIESGSGLPLGNLSSTTSAITVTSGASSVFVPTGVTLTLVPGNINLSTLGGTLTLSQLDDTSASAGSILQHDGANWAVADFPEHNDLSALQGGTTDQYYHLTSAIYDVLTNSLSSRLVGRSTVGTGAVQSLTLPYSVTISSGAVQLTNDAASPGNSYYYGTNSGGTKGFFALPSTITSISVTDSADIDFTITNPTTTPEITGELITTGVVADTYGDTTTIPQITVDDKGRLTDVIDVPISITTSSISNFTEATQDVVGTALTAGSGISIVYNDPAGTITISSSTTYSDEQAQDAVGTILTDSSNIDFTYTDATPAITADLTTTGVIASTYGSALGTSYPRITVDDKGRITSAINQLVQINTTQINNFEEAIDDRVSLLLQAGTDITLTYDDVAGTLTIESTAAGAGGSGYDTIQEEGGALTARTVLNFIGAGITAADNAPSTRTDVTLDATLNALAAYNTNGFIAQTAADTFAGRTLTAASTKIVITDGDGVANNPTFDVDPAEIDINDLAGPLTGVNGGTGLSALGTANQLLGMNAAAAALEYKTLAGTTDQVTVTHGVGTVTLSLPQDIATDSEPQFRSLDLQDTVDNTTILNITSSVASVIQMSSTGGVSVLDMTSGGNAPTIDMTDSTSGSSTSGPGIHLYQSDNNVATASGDRLGYIEFQGFGPGNPAIPGARLAAFGNGTFTATSAPSYLSLYTTATGAFNPTERVRINSTGETQFRSAYGIRFYDSDNTNYIAIIPPVTGSLTADYTLTLPTTDGTANQLLTTNGSGVLSWTDPGISTNIYTADGNIDEYRAVTLDAPNGVLNIAGTSSLFEIGEDYIQFQVAPNADLIVETGGVTIDATGGLLNLLGDDIDIQSSDITFTLGSDATGDIWYRNASGNMTRLPIGSASQVLTVAAGIPSWATPAAGGSPAGVNYNLQYYNSGAFGADSNITVTPGAQMKLAVGTSTPAATLHAKNHNSAGSSTLLTENSSGNNIFQVLSSGYSQWGDNESLPRIYQTTATGGSVSYTAGGLTMQGFHTEAGTYHIFGIDHTDNEITTDGPYSVLRIEGAYTGASGATDYRSVSIAPTINQTGTATGDMVGVLVSPTLTSIAAGAFWASFYDTADDANAYGVYQAGLSSSNYFAGTVGIGTLAAASKLHVEGTTESTHYKGNSATPSYTLGSSSTVGTGATLTIVGTDAGFEATLITGTSITTVGTLFTITFDSAYDLSPIVTFSPRDLNSAASATVNYPYVNSTSTTNFTFNNLIQMTESTTHKWSFAVIGR